MTEQYANRSHPEHVVLEIGEDVGAIVVYTPASFTAPRSRSVPRE
jgi:hypothetical protein